MRRLARVLKPSLMGLEGQSCGASAAWSPMSK